MNFRVFKRRKTDFLIPVMRELLLSCISGKHYLYLDTIKNCGLPIRHKAWEINMAPTLMFTEVKRVKNIDKAVTQVSALRHFLIQILLHVDGMKTPEHEC